MDINANTTLVGGTHSNTPLYISGTGIQLTLGAGWTKGMLVYAIAMSGASFTIVAGTAALDVPTGTSASSSTALAGIVGLECVADGSLRAVQPAVAAAATVPGAPTALVLGAATATSQPITWTAPANNGGSALTGYRVGVRLSGSNGAYTYTDTGSTVTGSVVTGLTAFTAYQYVVEATNAIGNSVDSAPVTGSTAATVPGAPTGLTLGTATSTSQPLTWSAPASNGGASITSYLVGYRLSGSTGAYTDIDTGGNVTGYVITGLTPNTAYQFVVNAVNSAGPGADSTAVTGSTAAAAAARTLIIGSEFAAVTAFNAAAGPYDSVIFRARDTGGSGSATHVGLLMPNVAFASANTGFVSNTRAYTLDMVYVTATIGGTKYTKPLTFAGGASIAVPTTVGHVASELISISTLTDGAVSSAPLGQEYWFTGRMSFPVGAGISTLSAGTSGQGAANAIFYSSAAGGTPTGLNTGSTVSLTGGTPNPWHIPRVSAIGRFASAASVSAIELADSIGAGVGDPGNPEVSWGNGGFLSRGRHVNAFGSGKIAGMRWAASGSQVNVINLNGALFLPMLAYCNLLVDAWGTNLHPVSTAQERLDHQALWTAAADAGVSAIMKLSLWPAASSTDLWATIANQTPDTTRRAASEAWYATQLSAGSLVRGKVNYYTDLLGMRAANTGTDRYKWNADGVTANLYAWDSIHPSTQGHIAGAASYRASLLAVTL